MNKTRFLFLTLFVFLAAASRLLPHPPNFAPITAIALFAGAYFSDRRAAFAVPAAALLVSDLFLGFYGLMPVVYASFGLAVLIGFWLRGRCTAVNVTGGTLAASVLFFLASNFGVWAFGSLYPKTVEGLAACYLAAIPFFRNALLGDALYVAVLFGSFAVAQRKLPALRPATA